MKMGVVIISIGCLIRHQRLLCIDNRLCLTKVMVNVMWCYLLILRGVMAKKSGITMVAIIEIVQNRKIVRVWGVKVWYALQRQ